MFVLVDWPQPITRTPRGGPGDGRDPISRLLPDLMPRSCAWPGVSVKSGELTVIDFLQLAHDLGDTMAALKDVAVVLAAAITACAAAVTAYCAWRGLSEWRKKLRGEVDFNTARRLREATLRIDSAFQTLRAPMCFPHEHTTLEEGKPDFAVLSERWESVKPKWLDFVKCCVEAEALWSDDLNKAVKGLMGIGLDISIAFRRYAVEGEGSDQATKDTVFAKLKKADDKFDAKLEAAINSIKLFCAGKMDL